MAALLLLRADAGGETGAGHVMRMMALGEAWIDGGGVCILASAALPEALAERVRGAPGFEVIPIEAPAWSGDDAQALIAIAHQFGAKAIAVDSYLADSAYLATLEAQAPTAFIDDVARQARYPCSLLVNQNLSAAPQLYLGRASGRVLLGPSFVMLRREFAALRARVRTIASQAHRLLVTFGGADPKNASAIALSALGMARSIEATLLIGGANPRAEQLLAMAGSMANITIVRDARDMAERIAAADMVLSAGGTTIWEAAALGAPMMLVATTPEEESSARYITHDGGLYLGPIAQLGPRTLAASIEGFAQDLAARARSSVVGRALVDCAGAERVAGALRSLI